MSRVVDDLNVKIFADGADLDAILALAADKRIAGFTTNPTLMWKAGLTDYAEFAKRLLERITKHPISFEVFADDANEMRRQALMITEWGDNVYVKVPVSTTSGESMAPLVRELSESGVKVNVTAVFTTAQVELLTEAVKDGAPSYISVFAGRIADAGKFLHACPVLNGKPCWQVEWADVLVYDVWASGFSGEELTEDLIKQYPGKAIVLTSQGMDVGWAGPRTPWGHRVPGVGRPRRTLVASGSAAYGWPLDATDGTPNARGAAAGMRLTRPIALRCSR